MVMKSVVDQNKVSSLLFSKRSRSLVQYVVFWEPIFQEMTNWKNFPDVNFLPNLLDVAFWFSFFPFPGFPQRERGAIYFETGTSDVFPVLPLTFCPESFCPVAYFFSSVQRQEDCQPRKRVSRRNLPKIPQNGDERIRPLYFHSR